MILMFNKNYNSMHLVSLNIKAKDIFYDFC